MQQNPHKTLIMLNLILSFCLKILMFEMVENRKICTVCFCIVGVICIAKCFSNECIGFGVSFCIYEHMLEMSFDMF